MKKQFLISLLLIGGLLLSCTADQTPLETSSAVSDGTAYPPLTDSDSADARYLGDYTSYRISDFDGSRAVADASVSSFVSGELLYLDIGNGFSCYDHAGERVAEYTFDGFDRGLNTGMALLSGGNFAVMESLDVPYLTVIGADGEILHEAAFPDTFLPGMPAVLRADGQHIYALQGNYLYIFDTALNLQTALFLPNDVGGGLHIAADGTVVLGTDADRLYTAAPGTGTLSPYALPPLPETLSDAQVCFGLDGELYFADATGIYTVDETGEATEILSWASGGAVYSRSLFVADADTVFLYTENAPSGTAQFALLTPFSARDTSEARRILTLGILDSDENGYLASLIDRFNSTNEAYYVETVLYDMYNFRDAYRALTEAFLSSDGVPDMLCLFNAAYRNILGDMGDKNAFVDLTPYYADAVWGGLADACTSDGVLSFLPLGITVETLAVSSTLVGDGETLSLTDLYGMADALGAGQALFSDPKAAKNLYEQALWDFIDYENRDCAFDTDAFRDFIRFTERAETEYTDPTLGCFNQTYTMDANIAVSTLAMRDNLENGALLFMHLPLTHPKQYIAAKMMWGDTDFTLCGYPTAGGGGAAVTGAHFLGITSSSDVKGGAAAFSILRFRRKCRPRKS